jgi:hypothetical protein
MAWMPSLSLHGRTCSEPQLRLHIRSFIHIHVITTFGHPVQHLPQAIGPLMIEVNFNVIGV